MALGGAPYLHSVSITLYESTFWAITAKISSCASLSSATYYTGHIMNSNFQENEAHHGGAVQ